MILFSPYRCGNLHQRDANKDMDMIEKEMAKSDLVLQFRGCIRNAMRRIPFRQLIMQTNGKYKSDGRGRRLTRSATVFRAQQVYSGNYTVAWQCKGSGGKQLSKGRNLRQTSNEVIRVWTLNVSSVTEKGRELVDMMQRTNADIGLLCVQETKCKGSKARNIFKLVYYDVDGKE